MNRPHNIFKSRIWVMTWLLTAFVAGCGERTANTVTAISPGIVAASANTGLAGMGKGPAPVLLGTAGD